MFSSPLRISSPAHLRNLGMSLCPGKIDAHAMSGPCRRYLSDDIAAICNWGAALVITLLEDWETEYLQVSRLGDAVRHANMVWHHLPVVDGSVLRVRESDNMRLWHDECAEYLRLLENGAKIFVHCRADSGGQGHWLRDCSLIREWHRSRRFPKCEPPGQAQ